jgi:hypothetical protein
MTRTRITLTVTTLALTTALGLSGCGASGGTAAPAAADVADEAYALQAVGLETGLEAGPAPSPSASAAAKAPAQHRKAIRRYLRKNTLHGEVTLNGKKGARTIVVQRGTVTAVTSTGVSVKSADGFTLTWTFGSKLRVVQDKKTVQTSALKTGVRIGVAGTKDGSANSARLIAIG